MYRCEKCNSQVDKGLEQNRIIKNIRKVKYLFLDNRNIVKKERYGKETIKEENVCSKCYQLLKGNPSIIVGEKTVNLKFMPPKKVEKAKYKE